jgi:hypothetical protein
MKYLVNQEGTLQVGFERLYEIYIIMEVCHPRLKKQIPRRRNYSLEWRIAIPTHRVGELKRLLSDLIEDPPDEVLRNKSRDMPNSAGAKK